MAAAEHPLLDRVEPVLPVLHLLVRCEPVLDEVQLAAGLSTRRSSASAAWRSGIVHIVQVESAASKLSSSNGSDWPSRPARRTGVAVARTRFSGELPPTSAGSTADTLVTARG